MAQPAERRRKTGRSRPPSANGQDNLPYAIEIWNDAETKVPSVIARAQNASLARAIFTAACEENPDRRLRLRKTSRTLASSAG